ncbi:Pleckstrin domain [Trinorchestia longiramus]|nr:Pleckstrin domain [Trinorchestia longiramus]
MGRDEVDMGRNKVNMGRNKVCIERNKLDIRRNKVGMGWNEVDKGQEEVDKGRDTLGLNLESLLPLLPASHIPETPLDLVCLLRKKCGANLGVGKRVASSLHLFLHLSLHLSISLSCNQGWFCTCHLEFTCLAPSYSCENNWHTDAEHNICSAGLDSARRIAVHHQIPAPRPALGIGHGVGTAYSHSTVLTQLQLALLRAPSTEGATDQPADPAHLLVQLTCWSSSPAGPAHLLRAWVRLTGREHNSESRDLMNPVHHHAHSRTSGTHFPRVFTALSWHDADMQLSNRTSDTSQPTVSLGSTDPQLSRVESYKDQRRKYRHEKKRVAQELLSTLKDPSVVVLAEWLKIRGSLKGWTKLWCVLKPGMLLLYKSAKAKSGHWCGTVLLNTCELIERPSKKDGFCFKLFHPLEQSIWATRGPQGESIGAVVQPLPSSHLIFRAPSQAAGKCWMDAMELAVRCSSILLRSMTASPGKDAVDGRTKEWNEADFEKHFMDQAVAVRVMPAPVVLLKSVSDLGKFLSCGITLHELCELPNSVSAYASSPCEHCRAPARLQSCSAAVLLGCSPARLQSCSAAVLLGCSPARLQSCSAAVQIEGLEQPENK